MSNKKLVPVALKHPDKIMLHYGYEEIELTISSDFSTYIVSVEEDKLDKFKPYMAEGEAL